MQHRELNELLQEIERLDDARAAHELKVFDRLQFEDREVANLALEVFEHRAAAAGWLSSNCGVLGNEKPLALILHGNRDVVMDCLNRIKFGMWA